MNTQNQISKADFLDMLMRDLASRSAVNCSAESQTSAEREDFPLVGCAALTKDQLIAALFGEGVSEEQVLRANAEIAEEDKADEFMNVSNMPVDEADDMMVINVPGAILFDGNVAHEAEACVVLERHPISCGLGLRIADSGGNSVLFDAGTVEILVQAILTASNHAAFLGKQ